MLKVGRSYGREKKEKKREKKFVQFENNPYLCSRKWC